MPAINCKSHNLIAPHNQWEVCREGKRRICLHQLAWKFHVCLIDIFLFQWHSTIWFCCRFSVPGEAPFTAVIKYAAEEVSLSLRQLRYLSE